jgi:hypothetical protein
MVLGKFWAISGLSTDRNIIKAMGNKKVAKMNKRSGVTKSTARMRRVRWASARAALSGRPSTVVNTSAVAGVAVSEAMGGSLFKNFVELQNQERKSGSGPKTAPFSNFIWRAKR